MTRPRQPGALNPWSDSSPTRVRPPRIAADAGPAGSTPCVSRFKPRNERDPPGRTATAIGERSSHSRAPFVTLACVRRESDSCQTRGSAAGRPGGARGGCRRGRRRGRARRPGSRRRGVTSMPSARRRLVSAARSATTKPGCAFRAGANGVLDADVQLLRRRRGTSSRRARASGSGFGSSSSPSRPP